MYLRHINGYAAALKKENDFFRIAEFDHNATLQLLRLTVAKQEGIIEYQKTQYKKNTRFTPEGDRIARGRESPPARRRYTRRTNPPIRPR
jgi:hypothetical protein